MIYGNGEIKEINIGNQSIRKVYAGDDLVWQRQKPLILEFVIYEEDVEITLPLPVELKRIIYWGDGTVEKTDQINPSHIYASTGIYQVNIYGKIGAFGNASKGNYQVTLRRIISWGDKSLQITSLKNAFKGCLYLEFIPSDENAALSGVIDLQNIFSDCSGLTSLPDNLFAHCSLATNFTTSFTNCISIQSLPEDLFRNCLSATYFSNCFTGCTSLTTLPEGLFANCNSAIIFDFCFLNCTSITSIPENLFGNLPVATNFSSCFNKNVSLVSLPRGLFSNCPAIRYISNCFYGCRSLTVIPENLFENCSDISIIHYCFYNCQELTGTTPKDTDGGELWERIAKLDYPDKITGTRCFGGCFKLDNYSNIPSGWI